MFKIQFWTAKILFFSEIPKYYWIFFHFLAFFFSSGLINLLFFFINRFYLHLLAQPHDLSFASDAIKA